MKDFYAALEAMLTMYEAANDPSFGNPNGALAKRINGKLSELYKNVIPSMLTRLEGVANENGEVVRRGSLAGVYANKLFRIDDQTKAIGYSYRYLEPPAATNQGAPGGGGAVPGRLPGN